MRVLILQIGMNHDDRFERQFPGTKQRAHRRKNSDGASGSNVAVCAGIGQAKFEDAVLVHRPAVALEVKPAIIDDSESFNEVGRGLARAGGEPLGASQ